MTEAQARQVGRLIARARQAKGLSLRSVAELSDLSYPWLTRLERGVFASPAPERLARLAEVLDIDPDQLDRLSRGHVSSNLPGMRTYLRTKYDLNADQIARVEAIVDKLQQQTEHGYERGTRPADAA